MRHVRAVSAAGSDGPGAGAPEAPGGGGRAVPTRFRQSRRWGWRRPEGSACCGDPRCRFGSRAARPAAPTYDGHLEAREAFRAWAMAPEQGGYREMVRRELKAATSAATAPWSCPATSTCCWGSPTAARRNVPPWGPPRS